MTLRDIFNVATEIEYEGEKYRLHEPTLLEQGEFQCWLEQLAYDAIERRTYAKEDDRAKALQLHTQDCAAGVYEWGGDVAMKRVMTPKGLAKLLHIMCREQGMTLPIAEKLVDLETRKIAFAIASKRQDDPKVVEAIRATLGLPSETSSSESPTPHSDSISDTLVG